MIKKKMMGKKHFKVCATVTKSKGKFKVKRISVKRKRR